MSRDYHLGIAKPYSPTVWVSFYTDYYTPGVENLYFQSTTYNYAPASFTTERRFGTASYDEILWKPDGSIDNWARFQWNGLDWGSSAVATGSGQAGLIPKGAEYQTQDKFVPSNTWGLPTRPGVSDRWLMVKKSTGVAAPDPGQWTYYQFDYIRATLNYKPVAQGTVSGSVLDRIQFTADDGTVWADASSTSIHTYSSVTGQWTQTSSTLTAMPSVDNILEGTEWNSNKGYLASIAPPMPAPTNLRVIKPITETTIDLAWDAVISATSYKVYQATVAGGPYTLSTGTWLTTTDFRVTGLTKNTTYYFVVTALNGSVESPRSTEISRITMLPPLAPTVTNYSNLTDTSITLSWDVSLNTDTYEIWQDTMADSYGFPVVSGIVGTSFTVTGLTPNTLYCFSIASYNMGGLSDLNSPFLNVTTLATVAPTAPSAPTGVTVGAITDTTVALSWAAVSGAAEYHLYKATTSGGPWTAVAQTGPITGTSFTVDSLTANTTYYFAVTAANTVGESPKSVEVSAKTNALATPTAPTGLTVGVITETTVDLSWGAVSGAGSYNVYQSTVVGGPYSLVASGVAVTSYQAIGLTGGRTYYFTVTAVSTVGESPKSAEVSASTPAPLLPASPTVTVGTINETSVDISWNSVPNATSYNVYRSLTSGTPQLVQSGVTGTYFSNTGLSVNTQYFFQVSAVNATGEGVKSTEVSARTLTHPVPPAPTNLVVGTITDTTVDLTWGATADTTSYKVYISEVSGGPWTLTADNVTTASYHKEFLMSNHTYYFAVSSVNSGGESIKSAQVMVTTTTTPVPPAPSGLIVGAVTDIQVPLSWNGVAGATSYNVYKATVAGGPYTQVASGINVANYTVTGLTPNTTYYFTISAVNAGGEGLKSTEVLATTQPPIPPAPPTVLTAGTVTDTTVPLSWNIVAVASGYFVYRATTPGGPYTLITSPGGVTDPNYTDTGRTAVTDYYYAVSAKGAGGEGAKSAELKVTTAPTPPPATVPVAPTGVTVSNIKETSLDLVWSQQADANTFNVYKSVTSGGPWTLVQSGITLTGYTVTELTPNTDYFFAISGVNSSGEGAKSAQIAVHTLVAIKGSEADPYLIYTIADLLGVKNRTGVAYRLMNDIDLNVAPYNTGEGWVPLTDSSGTDFKGIFNGNGHVIYNLMINKPTGTKLGLFSSIIALVAGTSSGGGSAHVPSRVENLSFRNVNITGQGQLGSIAGIMTGSYIKKCYGQGKINGNDLGNPTTGGGTVGGLVGGFGIQGYYDGCSMEDSRFSGDVKGGMTVGGIIGSFGTNSVSTGCYATLKNCFSTGTVRGNAGRVGGLVGAMSYATTFQDCFSTSKVDVSGTYTPAVGEETYSAVGGLVGTMDFHINAYRCFAKGDVTALNNKYVGGFVGWYKNGSVFNSDGNFHDCYATGNVKGKSSVGGFFGYHDASGSTGTVNCHSVGKVEGLSPIGGFMGDGITTLIQNCFYDSVKSGQSDNGKGTPKTTLEMGTQSTFTGWDFSATWKMDTKNSYPILQGFRPIPIPGLYIKTPLGIMVLQMTQAI